MEDSGDEGARKCFQFALGDSVHNLIFINVHSGSYNIAGIVEIFGGDVSGIRGK